MKVKIRDLRPGDWLDLSGDFFAINCNEPRCEVDHALPWEYEYAVVYSVEPETDQCFAVTTENGDQIGFPPDHEVEVAKRSEGVNV